MHGDRRHISKAGAIASFVIFASPRSRTTWLSAWLAYGGWQCGHDELRHCRSLDDVRSWLAQPQTGTVETAAAPFWRLLERYSPEARIVTLRRPVAAVAASLARGGLCVDDAVMRRLQMADRKLEQIEHRLAGRVFPLRYEELDSEAACAELFTYCLGMPHDKVWWRACAAVNIQTSIPHTLRYAAAHAVQVEKLRRVAWWEMLRGLRRPAAMDGVTFGQETLAQSFCDPDGMRLMSEECVQLGAAPEAWLGMNLPLLERLEALDRLHIMTARSNGRMFGYLVTALGESFHAMGQLEADQVSYFADPTWPGLGRKLQHAAIDDLRAKGVNRVLMFQPDGTRVGLVYRRLGAKQTGQRYVLELQ